jgi:hypothetical protein
MDLRVIGAGLPRTGTASLRIALGELLGGYVYHMREILGHPFDLGDVWNQALAGATPDWNQLYDGYVAAVDWPTSLFWRELCEAYPDALVLLSVRDTAETWWHSTDETILPYARMALDPGWDSGCGLVDLLERFTGSVEWDDPARMVSTYERHNAEVRQAVPRDRLLEWQATQGWAPLCRALDVAVPEMPFPWVNRSSEWDQ